MTRAKHPVGPGQRVSVDDDWHFELGTAVSNELADGPYPVIRVVLDRDDEVHTFPSKDVHPFPCPGAAQTPGELA